MSGFATTGPGLIMQNGRSGVVKNSISFQLCFVLVYGLTTYHWGTQWADKGLKMYVLSITHPVECFHE